MLEDEKYFYGHATLSSKFATYRKRALMGLWGKKELSEKDIIIGCINGDDFCQEALYSRHSATMFGVCMRYSPDFHTAEDILQEGFMKVFTSILSYRGEGPFEGWMKRVFVNTAISHYRKTKGVIHFDEITDTTFYLFDEDSGSNMETADILKMIRELPDGYREILNLYAIEGYNHPEIAALLGISEGTSKSQLSRARNMLKKKLNESNTYYHETEQLGQLG